MSPSALWQSVKNIRDAFPNGTGFYVPDDRHRRHRHASRRTLQACAQAPTKPYYSYQMNEADRRDLLAAVTEGKTRSDFMTFAIHAHQFADTKGGERGAGLPDDRRPRHQPEHRRLPARARQGGDRRRRRRVPRHGRARAARHRDLQGPADLLRARRVLPPDGRRRPVGHGGRGPRRREQPADQIRKRSSPSARFERGTWPRSACTRSSSPTTCGWRIAACRASRRRQAAQRILTRLQKLSAPLGTTIAIEGNVGVDQDARRPVRACPSASFELCVGRASALPWKQLFQSAAAVIAARSGHEFLLRIGW